MKDPDNANTLPPWKNISRRELLRLAAGAGMIAFTGGAAMAASIITKPIPLSGEQLPVIGLGTWQTFDVDKSDAQRAPVRDVLRQFVTTGGKVVDSSPMYGRSEAVVGDLSQELRVGNQLFV